jgi:hypothetical protein
MTKKVNDDDIHHRNDRNHHLDSGDEVHNNRGVNLHNVVDQRDENSAEKVDKSGDSHRVLGNIRDYPMASENKKADKIDDDEEGLVYFRSVAQLPP